MARRWRREHRFWKSLVAFLVMLALLASGGWYYLDRSLHRTEALTGYPGRPEKVAGTNWLLVGTDARTVLFFHIPGNNVPPTLVSLPRDSALPGQQTLNAAYVQGGDRLLARTVEKETGLFIDHFAEIDRKGLAILITDIGGLPDTPTDQDPAAQQRNYLHALFRQATKPGVYANPSHLFPLISDAPELLTVDKNDALADLVHLAFAMRGDIVGLTVPMSQEMRWDQNKAALLFAELRHDLPISANLLRM